MDPDQFLADIYHLKDELTEVGKVFSIERLTTVILDASPSENYSVLKKQSIRDRYRSGLVDVERMMRTIHVNDVEKSSSGESSPERRENIHDSAMNTMSEFKGFV